MSCKDTSPKGISLPPPGTELTVRLEKTCGGEDLQCIPVFERERPPGPSRAEDVVPGRYVGELELELRDWALVNDAPDGTVFEFSIRQDESRRVTATIRQPQHPPVALPFRADVLRDSRRTLRSPLGISLLGVEPCVDLYLTNPFRMLGISASAPETLIAAAAQRLRNRLRLNRGNTTELSTHTDYDDLVEFSANDVAVILARLNRPRERVLSECFWLNLPTELMAVISSQPSIGSATVIEALNSLAVSSGEKAAITHALAIVHHNRAIAAEVGKLPGTRLERERDWVLALRYWAETMSLDAFWRMLSDRISERNDPRINQDHLSSLREDLPRAILAFNVAFARGHAQAEAIDACSRQLNLIVNSHFDDAAKTSPLKNATEEFVGIRLGPLQRRAQAWFQGLEEKVDWHVYDEGCGPLLDEMLKVDKWLAKDGLIPAAAKPFVVFDKLVEMISKQTRTRPEYNNEDRPRALLSDLEIHMRLKSMPVTAELKKQIDEATIEIGRYLDEYLPPQVGSEVKATIDPFCCWFLPGARASVADSIVIWLYRFDANDNEETSVDTLTWTKKAFFIPRSTLAKTVHEGGANVEDIPLQYLDPAGNESVQAIRDFQQRSAAIRLATLQSQEQEMSLVQLQEARLIAQYDRESAASSEAERTKVAEAQLNAHRLASQARAQMADAVQSAERAHEATIHENESRYQRAWGRYHGLGGVLRVPTVTGFFAAFFLIVTWVAASRFELSSASQLADPTVVALGLLGLLAGAAAGEAIRRRSISIPLATLTASRKALADEKMNLSAQCEELITTQGAKVAKLMSDAESHLNRIDADRLKFLATSESRIASAKSRKKDAIGELERISAVELGQLRRAMDRYLRPESDKLAFPGVAQAIEQGYVVGSRPTEVEISKETVARSAAITGVAGTSPLITPRNATTALLKSTLESAFSQVKQQGDWLVVESDCSVWIRLEPETETILLRSSFTFFDYSTENQRLRAVAAMNTGYGIIRAYVEEDKFLVFDYGIPLNGGIFKNSLVQAIRRFGPIPPVAIRSQCASIVK